MIKPVTMYSVVCDRCGKSFIDEFNGIVAWLDEGTASKQWNPNGLRLAINITAKTVMSLTMSYISMFLKRKEISIKRMAQKYIKDDIVMYDNRIHTIIDTIGLNNYELSYVRHPVNQAELSGVHITPDFLKKNGWKKFKRPYRRDYCFRRKGYPTLNIRSNNEVYFHWGDHDKSITAVHQLQHLLFGIGLNSEMEM